MEETLVLLQVHHRPPDKSHNGLIRSPTRLVVAQQAAPVIVTNVRKADRDPPAATTTSACKVRFNTLVAPPEPAFHHKHRLVNVLTGVESKPRRGFWIRSLMLDQGSL